MIAAADRQLESALRGRPRRKGGLYPATCQVCGDPFTSTRPDAESCSPKCRKRRQRQQEALSRITAALTTDVAGIVSASVTAVDTKRRGATPQSRDLDRREHNQLSWQLTIANSRCRHPGCREPRKGMVLRRRRPGEPMLCQRHLKESLAK